MTSFDASFDFSAEHPGDLLYEDFCDSFLCRVDYQLLTPGQLICRKKAMPPANVADKTEKTEDISQIDQTCAPPLSDVKITTTNCRNGRRERLRAKICRLTRAIFRETKVNMPRKKSDPENYKRGCEYFLRFAYGEIFDKGSYWYENPEPLTFFSLLFENASRGRVELTSKLFEEMFYKMGDHKSSGWRLNDDLCRELGLRAEDLMGEVRRVKTLKRADYLPRVVTDLRFVP